MTMFFDGTNDDEGVLNSFGQLPDGVYKVVLAQASKEWSRNNSEVGLLKCEFDILDEQYLGRKIFSNFILKHPQSPIAVEIGRAKFKKICLAAIGKPAIERPEDLAGKPFYLKMKTRTQKNGRESFDIDDISADALTSSPPASSGSLSPEELKNVF